MDACHLDLVVAPPTPRGELKWLPPLSPLPYLKPFPWRPNLKHILQLTRVTAASPRRSEQHLNLSSVRFISDGEKKKKGCEKEQKKK